MLRQTLVALTLCCAAPAAFAGPIYVEKVDLPMNSTMTELKSDLQAGGYKTVLNLNILKLIHAQQKTLKIPHFNAQHFTDVRALVFCNPYDFSNLLNSDWPTAAGCPLNLTVLSKGNTSYIVYGLRADYASNPASQKITATLDQGVIKILQEIPMSRALHTIPKLG